VKAADAFYRAAMSKLAGDTETDNSLTVPLYASSTVKEEIIQAVSTAFPDAKIHRNPRGLLIVPAEPAHELDKIENVVQRMDPSLKLEKGPDRDVQLEEGAKAWEHQTVNAQTGITSR
jgi:hypothetical protein